MRRDRMWTDVLSCAQSATVRETAAFLKTEADLTLTLTNTANNQVEQQSKFSSRCAVLWCWVGRVCFSVASRKGLAFSATVDSWRAHRCRTPAKNELPNQRQQHPPNDALKMKYMYAPRSLQHILARTATSLPRAPADGCTGRWARIALQYFFKSQGIGLTIAQ